MPRWGWLLIATAVLLVVGSVFVQVVTPAENGETLPPGTSLSAAPNGTLALYRWLEASGYRTVRVREYPFDAQNLDALLVIQPDTEEFTDGQVDDLTRFVDGGGTLVLVTDGSDETRPVQRGFGVEVRQPRPVTSNATTTPIGPSLARPPVRTVGTGFSEASVRPVLRNDAHFLPRAENANGTFVATLTRGQGRVHIVAGPRPFTNRGLPEADNLALVQNVLNGLPAGATVGFDEIHHGFGAGSSITDLALRSPWGWTLIYLTLLAFLAFVLNGRRFGRATQPAPAIALAPAAYARALGDRWREAGQRGFAGGHLADDLKRTVAVAFSLDPQAPDAEFVARLDTLRPDLAGELGPLLTGLREPGKRDSDLVALAHRAEVFRGRVGEGAVVGVRRNPPERDTTAAPFGTRLQSLCVFMKGT